MDLKVRGHQQQVGLKTRWQVGMLRADPSLEQLVALSLLLGALFCGMGPRLLEEKDKVSAIVSRILERKKGYIVNIKTSLFLCFRKFLRSLPSAWYIQMFVEWLL